MVVEWYRQQAHAALSPATQEEIEALIRDGARDGVLDTGDRDGLRRHVAERRLDPEEVSAFVDRIAPAIESAARNVARGLDHRRHGDLRMARDAFLLATREDSKNPGAWVNLGAVDFQTSSVAEAERAFERALDLDPESWTARYNLAAARASRGESDAVSHLRTALDLFAASGPSEDVRQRLRSDLLTEPAFDDLRRAPDFADLLGHPALTSGTGGASK